MRITSGAGVENAAEVDRELRLHVNAIGIDLQMHINEDEAEYYSLVLDQATGGTNRHIIYIKNTSQTSNIVISSITAFATTTATELYALLAVTGTATSPTTATPVNRNGGSGNTATGTFQTGANLTMTGGSEVDRWKVLNDVASAKHSWDSGLILPKNATFVLASAANTTVNVTISFGYHSTDL